MTAVDTNVLVRIITNDDERQAARAALFLRRQDRVFLAKTVLLELEWVLRRGYRYTPHQVLAAFRALINTRNVEVEDELAVSQAIHWYQRGMDFADSLHVASAGPLRSFATFDVALQQVAQRLGVGKTAAL
ncbi:MAG: type II toxin-antitoxin system VapC family toxin [Candidatus Korobacteraceae bacterium]|jgi:predicted nucleic-acid-binding protein